MALAASLQEPRDTLPSLKQGVTPADTKLTIRHGLFGNKVPIQVCRPPQTLAPASLTRKAASDSAQICATLSPSRSLQHRCTSHNCLRGSHQTTAAAHHAGCSGSDKDAEGEQVLC